MYCILPEQGNPVLAMTRNRSFCLRIVLAVLIWGIHFSVADAFELSQTEQEYLKNKGTVVFVSQTNYPPFEFTGKNGQREGMMLDLVRWIGVEAGFQPVFEDMTFLKAQLTVQRGQADVLTSLFYSETRTQRFEFSRPLFAVPALIYVQSGRTDIKDLEDLNGKSIAIQRGDYAKDFLEDHKITFTSVDASDFEEAIEDVIEGKADALIGDQQIVAYSVASNHLADKLKTVGRPLYIGQNCMAAAKDQQVLIGILNKGIAEASKKGVLEKISKKWLGEQRDVAVAPFWSRYTLLLAVCIGILLITLLLIYWRNARLRSLVDQKSQTLASTEKALHQSEKNFSLFFQTIDDLIFVADATGHIYYANPAVQNKLRYSLDELSQMHILDVHPQNLRQEAEEIFAEMFAGNRQTCPLPLRNKNGDLVPVETRVWFGEWNGVPCIYGICKDLSNEQEALQKFNRLFDNNPALMALSDIDSHRFYDVNKAFCRTLGYEREEVLGKTSYELGLFVHPELHDQAAATLLTTGRITNCELQIRCKNGFIIDGLFAGEIIFSQGKKFYLTVMIDLTPQKKAERALQTSEQEYRHLFNTLIDVYYRIDREGRFTMVSPSITRLTGFQPEEILGRKVQDFYVSSEERRQVAYLLQYSGIVENFNIQMKRKDGALLWVSCSARVKRDEAGKLIEIEGIARDITDRKRIEVESAHQQWRLSSILEGTNSGTWEWNIATDEVIINSRWAEIIGYTIEELAPFTGAAWTLRIHPEDQPEGKKLLISHFKQTTQSYEHEYRIQHRDGHWIWVADHGRVLARDTDGRAMMMFGTHLDISEKKRKEDEQLHLERRLLYSQKNESLGRMAGAIAHHFNNLLAGIMGNLELAVEDVADATAKSFIGKSIQASEKAAALSQLMLTYLGQNISEKIICNLSTEVINTLPLIEASLPQKVQLKKSIDTEIPTIFADPDAIRQTLVNLAVNAWEALGSEGGTIELTTGARFYSEESLRRASRWQKVLPGTYVFLRISDTGCGMDDKTLELMFDPFFSTKFTGRGLGLATVAGMVRSCQGAVLVSSVEKQGTTIEILLPVYDEGINQPNTANYQTAAQADIKTADRHRTVLLADDDVFFRNMATTMLQKIGLAVLVAQDGNEAVHLFEKHHDHISLAVLDLSMPGMNGWEVLQVIREHTPEIPALLVSGYTEKQAMQTNYKERPQIFLTKPFKIAELRQAIDSLLDQKGAFQRTE